MDAGKLENIEMHQDDVAPETQDPSTALASSSHSVEIVKLPTDCLGRLTNMATITVAFLTALIFFISVNALNHQKTVDAENLALTQSNLSLQRSNLDLALNIQAIEILKSQPVVTLITPNAVDIESLDDKVIVYEIRIHGLFTNPAFRLLGVAGPEGDNRRVLPLKGIGEDRYLLSIEERFMGTFGDGGGSMIFEYLDLIGKLRVQKFILDEKVSEAIQSERYPFRLVETRGLYENIVKDLKGMANTTGS